MTSAGSSPNVARELQGLAHPCAHICTVSQRALGTLANAWAPQRDCTLIAIRLIPDHGVHRVLGCPAPGMGEGDEGEDGGTQGKVSRTVRLVHML
jgi:hypothetical protein